MLGKSSFVAAERTHTPGRGSTTACARPVPTGIPGSGGWGGGGVGGGLMNSNRVQFTQSDIKLLIKNMSTAAR